MRLEVCELKQQNKIKVNGREFRFQDFCNHMLGIYKYLANSQKRKYRLVEKTFHEGIYTQYTLQESRNWEWINIGPQITFCKVSTQWIHLESGEEEITSDDRSILKCKKELVGVI